MFTPERFRIAMSRLHDSDCTCHCIPWRLLECRHVPRGLDVQLVSQPRYVFLLGGVAGSAEGKTVLSVWAIFRGLCRNVGKSNEIIADIENN